MAMKKVLLIMFLAIPLIAQCSKHKTDLRNHASFRDYYGLPNNKNIITSILAGSTWAFAYKLSDVVPGHWHADAFKALVVAWNFPYVYDTFKKGYCSFFVKRDDNSENYSDNDDNKFDYKESLSHVALKNALPVAITAVSAYGFKRLLEG